MKMQSTITLITNVEATMPIERNPISRIGKVTNGPTTVLIIDKSFRKINRSFAVIIVEKTLMGNWSVRLMVSKIISILPVLYSVAVSPVSKINDKCDDKNIPHTNAIIPIILKISKYKPFKRNTLSSSPSFLYLA